MNAILEHANDSGRTTSASAAADRSLDSGHGPARPISTRTTRVHEVKETKTADIYTCREIMRIRAGIEPDPKSDQESEYFWAELLKDCAEQDVFEAAWAHYRTEQRPLWPADILNWVRTAENDRMERADVASKRLLMDRALSGWPPEVLDVWNRAFKSEIGRGAPLSKAQAVADLSAADIHIE